MSAALSDPHFVSGPGWTAEVDLHVITLCVSPEGDPLPRAIEALLAPSQRRYWLVEWLRENHVGWDVYAVTRIDGRPNLSLYNETVTEL